MKLTDFSEGWSKKYKKSIDCSNPKGFSQKAHCAGRKKKKSESVEEQIGTGRRLTVQPHMTGLENPYQKQDKRELKVFTQSYKDMYDKARAAQDKADATGGPGASYEVGLANPKFSPQVVPPRTKPKKPRPTLNPPLNNSIQELKIVKPDSANTKGLKRSQMPQIHKDDYNEFIDYLKDNGAEFTKQTMPAKQLKATQGEFSDKGVMKQIRKQMAGEPRKPVIASQDNFIIDGHHRWLVAWNTSDTVDVFKVNMDADKLLALVKKFPKTTYKDIYTEELYKFDKDEPMKSTVAVRGYGTMSIDGLMQNLVQSVTELLGRMKQGTDGMRFADYELNKNKVLTTKLSSLIQALDDLQAIRKQGGARSRNIQKEMQDYQTVTIPKKNPLAKGDLVDVQKMSKAGKAEYDRYEKQLAKDPNKTFTMKIPSVKFGENQEQQELPIDVNKILGNVQEFESKQFITAKDADMMRRAIQSLTSGRQTVYPEAILKLLTMVTR